MSPRLARLTGSTDSRDLDASYWDRREEASSAVLRAVLAEATHRAVGLYGAVVGPLPGSQVVDMWPIGARTRNAHGRLINSYGGVEVTLGTILNLPTVGIRSVLDLLAAFEVHGSSSPAGQVESDEDRLERAGELAGMLETTLAAPYIEFIRSTDLRFGLGLRQSTFSSEAMLTINLLSGDATSEAIERAEHLLRIFDSAASIVGQSLNEALNEVLRLGKPSAKNLPALQARFGLHGGEPVTLESAAAIAGVTRERIRQIEVYLRKRLNGRVRIPQLEAAYKQVQAAAPLHLNEVPQLLVDGSLATEWLSFRTLKKFAETIGLAVGVEVVDGVVATPAQHALSASERLVERNLERAVKQISRPHGFLHEAVLLDQLALREQGMEAGSIHADLRSIEGSLELSDGWWWVPSSKTGSSPALNVTKKIALVAGRPFTPRDVRRALLRLAAYRGAGEVWAHPVPPARAIEQWAELHPDVTWDHDQQRLLVDVEDADATLGDSEWALVDILSASPGGIATREEVIRTGVEMGYNGSTLSTYLSYSAVVEQVEHNIWGLRGAERDSQAVDILRGLSARQPNRDRRSEDLTRTGVRVRYQLSITDLSSVALYFSASARQILPDQLAAVDTNRTRHGTIRIDGGNSWGYGGFLTSSGAEEGDVLVVDVDVSTATATLSIDEGPI